MTSNVYDENDKVARFEGEEARAFVEYAKSKSTPREIQQLHDALEFYKQHCPKTTLTFEEEF